MMKNYHIYVFSQDICAPCERLKSHVQTLSEDEKAELDFVPLKTASGERTALARRVCGGTFTDSLGGSRDQGV